MILQPVERKVVEVALVLIVKSLSFGTILYYKTFDKSLLIFILPLPIFTLTWETLQSDKEIAKGESGLVEIAHLPPQSYS